MSNEPTKAELMRQIAELEAENKKLKNVDAGLELVKIERNELREALDVVRHERDSYKGLVLTVIDLLIDAAKK